VCHSHTDAGWYLTYNSYYTSKVQRILNSVVETLSKNRGYKFNWSDTSFLARWYSETSKDDRDKLHELVRNGQFQFMGGGWVMNDESLTVYKNAFLQIQTGIDWIESTFGVRPKIGWQIDPFGNSAVTPSILSILGYEGIVLSRIGTTFDYDLEISQNSEFIWEGAKMDSEGKGQPILAHHLVRSKYQAPVEFKYQPEGFPFWVHPKEKCSNIDELKSNYRKCIKLYYEEVLKPSMTGHRHNLVLSVFGDDFAYYDADYNFKYIDAFMQMLRDYSQEVLGKKINIHYSSVNDYFDAVKKFNGGNIEFPKYKADFLPYVQLEDNTFDHWVGYYSSTPVLKQMIRALFQKLRSLKIEFVAAMVKDSATPDFRDQIKEIQQEASIMMHHDAITSTSPSGTLADYKTRINSSERKIETIESKLLDTFIRAGDAKNSQNKIKKLKGAKIVTVFNPMGYERTEIKNFTTSFINVQVFDSEGNHVEAEVFTEYLSVYTFRAPNNPIINDFIVTFEVTVPPFSMTKYFYKEIPDVKD
jgi:hypothetical protein